MNLYAFVSFFYGAIGGAFSCIFFFFVVFRRIKSLLANTVHKKARKHAEFAAVAREAAIITPAKVETLCKMARFDDGIVGEAIQCRMVFYSGTIDVYEVDELRTLPDHRQEVVKEHLLGRIRRACVIATGERISKYHRHRNKSTRYASVKGKCTVLKHREGASLFLEDPEVQLRERLHALKEDQRQQARVDRLRRQAARDGVAITNEEALEQVQQMLTAANKDSFLKRLATATGAVVKRGDVLGFVEGSRRASCCSHASSTSGGSRRGRNPGGRLDGVPLSQWGCLAIKFPTRRIQERWLNLLQATPLSTQWHEFIQHLPKMDVFNLLIARLFFENSRANTLHDLLEEKLKKKLERVSKSLPQRLRGSIYLDALDVGGEIPLIGNVSDPTPSPCGDTEFDFDVLYRGGFAIKIRFAICYRDIRVPDIVFSIKILELAGRMRFVVGPPPTKKFWLGCPRPPQLRLHFTQEVASHDGILNAVLKLLPDMSQVASNVVTSLFFEDMVFPNLDDFPWPVLGEDDSDDSDDQRTTSDVEEYEVIHRESMSTLRSEEMVVGGPHQLPGERYEDLPEYLQTAAPTSPSMAAAPARKISNSHKNDTHLNQDRPSAMQDMPSPPPRPPPSRLAAHRSVEVPMRRASSLESGKLEGTEDNLPSQQIQPSASTPHHFHSCGDSTTSLTTAPPGLPPRPPRASTATEAKDVRVPTSRAPRSASYRISHFSDFREPEDDEEEEE
ncbi:hypothetical protein ABL78_3367 [Leptomonas seymouri]|uniref:SMP-LTD domain-containing protein n=1 Tax=Leptomonas seymouri TaxID=5684 RepID=A0A0N1PDN3_LEPSE|nr:hypothetical protein ABL78_3367 [Leptomonas seymouri]|eukprot:KPI87570.1 hypothetical protein ABL78_3367 [Leptomonas seymouri]